MKHFIVLVLIALLVADEGAGRSIKDSDDGGVAKRSKRGLEKFNIFQKKTTTPATTTTTTPKPIRDSIVECKDDEEKQKHRIIYIEDIKVDSSNSTLEGTVEIHIDSPYQISCIDIYDETERGTDLRQVGGGEGQKFVIIEVKGKYGAGIHMKIVVRGTKIEAEAAEIDAITKRMRDKIAAAAEVAEKVAEEKAAREAEASEAKAAAKYKT